MGTTGSTMFTRRLFPENKKDLKPIDTLPNKAKTVVLAAGKGAPKRGQLQEGQKGGLCLKFGMR